MLKKIAKFIIKYVDWIYLALVSLFIVAYIASECGLPTIRGIIVIFSMVVLVCWFIAMYYMMHNKD